jgi:hypothetical protein
MKKDSSNSSNKSVRGILILIIVVCISIIGYIYKDNILSYLADTIKIDKLPSMGLVEYGEEWGKEKRRFWLDEVPLIKTETVGTVSIWKQKLILEKL